MLPMNSALDAVQMSGIRRFNALAKATPGCLLLTLGEPEFDTPAQVSACVGEALAEGRTHYPANNGEPYLVQAISEYMAAQGLSYAPDEVIVTVGATEALFATLFALVEPGDEVIIPTPAFGLYDAIVRMCRGVPVALDTCAIGFEFDRDQLAAVVSPRTKALVITSPNNPTGCVYGEAALEAAAQVARETGMFVICDDVYNRLVYAEAPAAPAGAAEEPHPAGAVRSAYPRFAVLHPDLRAQTVVVDSFSKPWAMTGWRLGWLAADRCVKEQIQKVHQYMVSSVPNFLQPAAVSALLTSPDDMKKTYRARRDTVVSRLRAAGFELVEPQGAFYVFPSIERFGLGSEEFCERLIREAGVGLVPGTCFGAEGFVRLSYCVSDDVLQEALSRIERWVASL